MVGIDFSRECLKEARNRLKDSAEEHKIELQYAHLYKLPSNYDEKFDFVCANDVIHYLPDPKGGLEVMARCTRKEGHAFLFCSVRMTRLIGRPSNFREK